MSDTMTSPALRRTDGDAAPTTPVAPGAADETADTADGGDAKAARRPQRPRQEVMDAIVQAAAELFSERSPSVVSVREIAARAGVQHSLVHRHFGTKEDLIRAVVERGTWAYRRQVESVEDPVESFIAGYRYLLEESALPRVMMRVVLDGMPPRTIQEEYPGLGWHVEHLSALGTSRYEPGIAVAGLAAFLAGAVVAEPWVRAAAGVEEMDDDEFHDKLSVMLADLVRMVVSGPPAPDA